MPDTVAILVLPLPNVQGAAGTCIVQTRTQCVPSACAVLTSLCFVPCVNKSGIASRLHAMLIAGVKLWCSSKSNILQNVLRSARCWGSLCPQRAPQLPNSAHSFCFWVLQCRESSLARTMVASEADSLRSLLARIESDGGAPACPCIPAGLFALDGVDDHAAANEQIDRAVSIATKMLSREEVSAWSLPAR